MALADWTTNFSGVTVSLEITTPLVGNGSLKHVVPAGSHTANMYLTNFAKGFTKGRIRTLLRYVVRPSANAQCGSGIIFMQSNLNPVTTASNYYKFFLGPGTAGGSPGTQYWQLTKHTSRTLVQTPSNILVETSSETAANNDYWPIQIEWIVDLAGLGGTRLTASKGTKNSTDFNTLATIYDHLDTSTPHTTSVGEGLFTVAYGTGVFTTIFDETSIYELA